MSLGSIWAALREAPRLAEGLVAFGNAVTDGRGPIVGLDLFVTKSGLGGEAAGDLRALGQHGVRWLAVLAGVASEIVAREPAIKALLLSLMDRTLDAGLWAASQEAKLKGWLEDA